MSQNFVVLRELVDESGMRVIRNANRGHPRAFSGTGGPARGLQPKRRGGAVATPRTFERTLLSSVQCFACKEMGHISRNCPMSTRSARGI